MTDTSGVEAKDSQITGAGRGLFATKAFAPGDLVCSIDRALVAELGVDRLSDTCAWCFQRAATDPAERQFTASMGLPSAFTEVKACTGCHRIAYCSKKCQTKAWKAEHKVECKILTAIGRSDLPPHVRATMKLLNRFKVADQSEKTSQRLRDTLDSSPSASGIGIDAIARHDKKRFDDYTMMANAAWQLTGKPNLGSTDGLSISKSFLFNSMCNSFPLSFPIDQINLGVGFDPLLCKANHSCDPNAAFIFNQPQMALRALKPITKGEEILLSYTDATYPLNLRQGDLSERYFFNCKCPKCKEGPIHGEDRFLKPAGELPAAYRAQADNLMQRHQSTLDKFLVKDSNEAAAQRLAALQAEAFLVCDNDEADIEEVKNALKMCIESGMWSWTRQPVPQLCRKLYVLYVAHGDTYRAFRLGCKMYFEIDPVLYPQPFYPTRIINTWTMQTATNSLCGPKHKEIYNEMGRSGIDLRVVYFGFLFEAHDNIPRIYGLDSPFGKIVDNIYKQAVGGMKVDEFEIREKIRDVWPSLETIARSVNISSL